MYQSNASRVPEMLAELQATNDDRPTLNFDGIGADFATLNAEIGKIWADGAVDRMHRNNELYAEQQGWTGQERRQPVAVPLERPVS
jgi:hypothetical protein